MTSSTPSQCPVAQTPATEAEPHSQLHLPVLEPLPDKPRAERVRTDQSVRTQTFRLSR
jgi:hypothetical protein